MSDVVYCRDKMDFIIIDGNVYIINKKFFLYMYKLLYGLNIIFICTIFIKHKYINDLN